MGTVSLPESGLIYLDTSPIIYAVEKIPPYDQLLQPLWKPRQAAPPYFIGSELLLLETLVKPVQAGDELLQTAFRHFLYAHELQLIPISVAILETAVQLRATAKLKTPDAIHAATALRAGCDTFITNDPIFRRIPNLSVIILDELLPK
ncbi:MAG: PIN domain-containing protein [Anaerolineae bacterium]|nr:PIN domain-containing protein [Anaerolineae bacterium]